MDACISPPAATCNGTSSSCRQWPCRRWSRRGLLPSACVKCRVCPPRTEVVDPGSPVQIDAMQSALLPAVSKAGGACAEIPSCLVRDSKQQQHIKLHPLPPPSPPSRSIHIVAFLKGQTSHQCRHRERAPGGVRKVDPSLAPGTCVRFYLSIYLVRISFSFSTTSTSIGASSKSSHVHLFGPEVQGGRPQPSVRPHRTSTAPGVGCTQWRVAPSIGGIRCGSHSRSFVPGVDRRWLRPVTSLSGAAAAAAVVLAVFTLYKYCSIGRIKCG